MDLFILNNTNYSNNIINESFDVQKNNIYNEWVDGNYTTHKALLRTKITGSFNMRFRKLEEYQAFARMLEETRTTQGYNLCFIHANNTDSFQQANLFINIAPKLSQKTNLILDYGEFVVNVEEA